MSTPPASGDLVAAPSEAAAAHVIALLALAACAGCNGDVHEPDAARRDAGRDAPIDAPIECETPYTFVREAGPTERCAPWVIPPHPVSRLALAPAGAPYVVWEWSPVGDPILATIDPIGGHNLNGISIGPDGGIWALTPNNSSVTSIGHDGRTRWAYQTSRPFREVAYRGPVTLAPDGSGFFEEQTLEAVEPRIANVIHLGRDGRFIEQRAIERGAGPTAFRQYMSVAPDGAVYYHMTDLDEGEWLLKSCGGSESTWEWRLRSFVPEWPAGAAPLATVDVDGSMLAPMRAVRAYIRISATGEVHWQTTPGVYV